MGKRTWVICGGEEHTPHHRCRYIKPAWARSIRDQCAAAGIPFFFVQMSMKEEIPLDLRIKQFPKRPPGLYLRI
jgi:protein gp37